MKKLGTLGKIAVSAIVIASAVAIYYGLKARKADQELADSENGVDLGLDLNIGG